MVLEEVITDIVRPTHMPPLLPLILYLFTHTLKEKQKRIRASLSSSSSRSVIFYLHFVDVSSYPASTAFPNNI